MNYKLLWQLELEENTKLKKRLRVLLTKVEHLELNNTKQLKLLQKMEDIKDKILLNLEEDRAKLYIKGGLRV